MEEKISVETLMNRRARLEREKAMNAARYPKESKFGECLLNINTKTDPLLCRNLGKINSEYRRMEIKLKQLRQTFVRQSKFLNHEPLILVERPASPEVRIRKTVMETGADDPEIVKLPGYMRPLRTRCRTPSTLTTIDAFMVRTKKKRNVWEEAMDEKEKPSFKSTVRPCSKLTQRDITEIQYGWLSHKTQISQDGERSSSPPRATPKSLPDDSQVFITQLPQPNQAKSAEVRSRSAELRSRSADVRSRSTDVRSRKSVRFKRDDIENYPPSITPTSSKSRSKPRRRRVAVVQKP